MDSGSSSNNINDATGREQEEAEEEQPGLGVYVHWPYCSRICPYCDFNRYLAEKGGSGIDHRRMTQSYKTELAAFRRFLDSDGDPAVFAATTASTQTPEPTMTTSTTATTTTTTAKSRPRATSRRKVRSVFFGGGTPSLAKVRTTFVKSHRMAHCCNVR
jgi:coproporphyrinogen III oxidase-like Fe-S oxidoreductase